MVRDGIWRSTERDSSTHFTSLQNSKALHFGLLMKNLDILEHTIADSGVVRLERDILVHLERLGALKLFQNSLCRSLKPSTLSGISDRQTELVEVPQINGPLEDLVGKKVVHSVKKEERKLRRKKSLDKGNHEYMQEKRSKSTLKDPQWPKFSPGRRSSHYRRLEIARNEAEMSRGVKVVSIFFYLITNFLSDFTKWPRVIFVTYSWLQNLKESG